jgi:hypothetical protein
MRLCNDWHENKFLADTGKKTGKCSEHFPVDGFGSFK